MLWSGAIATQRVWRSVQSRCESCNLRRDSPAAAGNDAVTGFLLPQARSSSQGSAETFSLPDAITRARTEYPDSLVVIIDNKPWSAVSTGSPNIASVRYLAGDVAPLQADCS